MRSVVQLTVLIDQDREDCLLFNANTLAHYLVGLESDNKATVLDARVEEVRATDAERLSII